MARHDRSLWEQFIRRTVPSKKGRRIVAQFLLQNEHAARNVLFLMGTETTGASGKTVLAEVMRDLAQTYCYVIEGFQYTEQSMRLDDPKQQIIVSQFRVRPWLLLPNLQVRSCYVNCPNPIPANPNAKLLQELLRNAEEILEWAQTQLREASL